MHLEHVNPEVATLGSKLWGPELFIKSVYVMYDDIRGRRYNEAFGQFILLFKISPKQ
jgi:hypothetical protein